MSKKKRYTGDDWMDNQKMSSKDRVELLDMIGDDLPDGAYFAMAEEMGIGIDDFIAADEEGFDNE